MISYLNYLKYKRSSQNQSSIRNCKSCSEHKAEKQACPAFKKQCHNYGKLNHFKKVCYSAKSQHTFQSKRGSQKFSAPKHINKLAAGSDMIDEDLFIIEAIETVDRYKIRKKFIAQ